MLKLRLGFSKGSVGSGGLVRKGGGGKVFRVGSEVVGRSLGFGLGREEFSFSVGGVRYFLSLIVFFF